MIDANYYYVDKTLLIKEVLERGEVVVIRRPRRFGKTLNLSMIRYFLEDSEESTSYLFEGTSIWCHEDYRQLQGSAPVVFVTFKDIKERTWEKAFDSFSVVLQREFDRHAYLLHASFMASYEKELFLRIINREASEVELKMNLLFLTKLLHVYHKKKPYVLLDEYDIPIQEAYIHGYYEDAIQFLQGLLGSVLKDNSDIEKGIVTSILTLTKAGIFSGLNNLDVYDLTSVHLSDKFGFTETEVKELLAYYGVSHQEQEIKQWYNGYTFGKTSSLYNPWSVLSCLRNEGLFQNYWVSTSGNLLVKKLIGCASIEVKSKLEMLISGKDIAASIDKSIIFPQLDTRHDVVWSLLLYTGYLTYSDFIIQRGMVFASLKIPNEELLYLYTELIQEIFTESVSGGKVANLLEARMNGDTENFSKLLQSFVYISMSSFDFSSDEPEKSYHLFVLVLMVALHDSYEVASNKESGLGRYDISMIPRVNNKPGIVIEFKGARKGETLETAAQKALDQISQKKYTQELHNRSIKKFLRMALRLKGRIFMLRALSFCSHGFYR